MTRTRNRLLAVAALLTLVATFLMAPSPGLAVQTKLQFSGGPEGGTFQYFSYGISTLLSKDLSDVKIRNMASAGSVSNITRVNSGEADFGIAYSGDTYLARNGRLTNDDQKYKNVYTVAFLYGAPVHLVVLADSGIDNLSDLVGKRVAVGGSGSGAAAAAERYFGALGLWDKMNIEYLGYSKAASALEEKLIDAMWVLAGFPTTSIKEVAAGNKIKIIDTWETGVKGGVFDQYPFYAPVTIPAGIYRGIDHDVQTFQDSAVWVAGKHVKPELVYQSAKDIFTAKGLAHMVKVKSTAKAMSVNGALAGIVTPLHGGAEKFWREKGLPVTEKQTAR